MGANYTSSYIFGLLIETKHFQYLQIPDIDPSSLALDGIVSSKNLWLQPGQVVNPDTILFARNSHENVLPFKNFHLLETSSTGSERLELNYAILFDFISYDLLPWY